MASYRSILEIEGAPDMTRAMIIGDEAEVERQLRHLAAIGVKDDAEVVSRTYAFLSTFARAGLAT